ncbi:hypothetical protein M569_12917, partial [Genlisea aurea]
IRELHEWNLLIRQSSAANPFKALSLFQEMRFIELSDIFKDDPFIYASLVKACGKARAFLEGKSIHGLVIRLGLDCNVNLLNSLTSFYMCSSDMARYASILFRSAKEKTVISVNCMISGYVRRGNIGVCFSLFDKMLRGCFGPNLKPNFVTFVILISGCVEYGDCGTASALHCCCFKIGFVSDTEVCNALINMYAKFGYLSDAMTIFRDMPRKDLFSWNSLIHGYSKICDERAFTIFRNFRISGIGTDKVSLSCLLSACAARKDLSRGEALHSYAIVIGQDSEDSVGTALINMYTKCGLVKSARKFFDQLPKQNIELWNAMIHGYVENGNTAEVLMLSDRIKTIGLEPDEVTILGLIMACRDTGDLRNCSFVHSMVRNDKVFHQNLVLGNALIDMYAKCGCMAEARSVFDTMVGRDVITWTSMIVGYAVNGEGRKSVAIFHQMCEDERHIPNSVTFIGVLSACDYAGMVDEGRKLFDMMYRVYDIEPQIEHCGCIVDMLARSGMVEEAERFVMEMAVQPNAVIWRMLMNGCRVHGEIKLGFKLLELELDGAASYVASSNIYAEAERWGEVVGYR